jgi:hypothetical protein
VEKRIFIPTGHKFRLSRRTAQLSFKITVLLVAWVFLQNAFGERALKVSKESAYSEQRVALVIGNSSYKTSPLKNPANDAADMAKKLEGLGFHVTRLLNASQSDMRKAIRQFGKDLKKGGVGLFFFAGHGMQVQGANYLIPVGADINGCQHIIPKIMHKPAVTL